MPAPLSPNRRIAPAEKYVADFFRSHDWSVEVPPHVPDGADLIIRRGKQRFIVEIKAVSESRPDRVLPVLSMAILQAQAAAKYFNNALPLAIVHVPEASPSLAKHVDSFAQRFAKDVPVGLISGRGEQYFSGAALQELNRLPEAHRRSAAIHPPQAINLFSDLNQWMLKLLLARELPEDLLNAPGKKFRSGSDLAEAAQVSAMSASRFLQQLRSEGYLSDSSPYLKLVRRKELFRRWGAAAMRSCPEMPCRFLLRAPVPPQIRGLLGKHPEDACLGLFAAADELHFGHVSGVPPYVYVRKLPQVGASDWSGLMAHPVERPDLILRQAPFPQSTFRGAVDRNGLKVTDVIQTWLDTMHHPTRGAEQAHLIYEKVLSPIVES
ncbi:RpiR family transcriptional regulator [Variovorax sp. MHTC-1]|uniref:RpiR family transcriptional regulator n=1 Tax=Variovorax sp. MHTC-1 TaxID=2495593 RepID=UPI000F881789|nr:RpiR family transcriptional regulator [Variovorax sp. MHTC-1]RST55003.1 RpiR family transcriptional regulator [Variovorax sp. MHTC-1]